MQSNYGNGRSASWRGFAALCAPLAAAAASGALAAPTETVLHSFTFTLRDGGHPAGGLIADSNGNFYGMTRDGGTAAKGMVFKLSPPATSDGAWTEAVLHSFTGRPYG